jgi:hypothetical protein
VIPQGSRTWVAGAYLTQASCNQAGARGVRQGKWDNYLCYFTVSAKDDWFWALSVTKDD